MADSLTYIQTDFSDGAGKLLAANGINVLRVQAHLDTPDTGAYCIVNISLFSFRLINKDFDGSDGEFYIDLSEILSSLFEDVSDNVIETGQIVNNNIHTFYGMGSLITTILYDANGTQKATIGSGDMSFLFAAPYFNSVNGTYLKEWYEGYTPIFIGQKNKVSYIYYFNNGAIGGIEFKFTKIDHLPQSVNLTDNYDIGLTDNDGNQLIYTI